ncbi:MAG: carbohydrate kinase family protein [Acidobacteriota bacterium]
MPSSQALTPSDKKILVAGSIAFDQIMTFPGFFKDHILPDKIHMINLSFLVKEFRKQRGGCAGNIGYSLALLGETPTLVATAGGDFQEYRDWLVEQGVDVSAVTVHEDEATASCFITSDQADNQITGFFIGAMARAAELSMEAIAAERGGADLCVVAPDDPEAMVRHCVEARRAGIPLVFDPSFQVIAMDGETLRKAAEGAHVVILNDYEYAVFQEKTGLDPKGLSQLADYWVVTYGEEGSEILGSDGSKVKIPAAKIHEMVDPTGAGDAFRSGFVAGMMRGVDHSVCGRMGSVAAAYVVEQYGTQSHGYTAEEFWQRYEENFGGPLNSDG